MRTRFLRGNTAENNGLTLESGEFSMDLEKSALRLHDGVTPGGFEIIGQRAYEGPTAGDLTAGFYGEVAGSDFITYDQLATEIGLSAGTSQFNAESAWLRYSLDGQELYVAMKPARHSISWNQIHTVGAVYDDTGAPTVVVGGRTYRVTLLRGASADPAADQSGYDLPSADGSEWNRLLYPVHSGVHTVTSNPTPHTDASADPYASWASYSDADLVMHSGAGNGSYNPTQESTPTNYRIARGSNGVSYYVQLSTTGATSGIGWRPCLRLVE